MKKLFLLTTMLLGLAAHGQVLAPSQTAYVPPTNLLVENPGFEKGKSKFIQSGGTFTIATSGTNLIGDKASAVFTASGSGQYIQSQLYTVPVALQGTNCMARMHYKDGDTNYKLVVLDGSSNVIATRTIDQTVTYRTPFAVHFVCPTSGSIRMRLESTASGAQIETDNWHLGAQDNIYEVGNFVTNWDNATFTGSATTNSTYSGKCRVVGDSEECRVRITYAGAPNAFSTLSLNLPFTIDTTKLQSTTTLATRLGTGHHYDPAGGTTQYLVGVVYESSTVVRIRLLAATGAINYQNFDISASIPFSIASGAYTDVVFTVPVSGLTAAQQIYTPSTVSAFAAVAASGTPSFSTTSTSYVDVTHSSFATKTYFGKASAPGTANDMALRITDVPAGTYMFVTNAVFTNVVGSFECAYRLYDGTNTIAEASPPLVGSSIAYDQYGNLMGVYTFSGRQADTTIKLQLKAPSGGTCLVGSNNGKLTISMIPLTQNLPVPILLNSLATDYAGNTKVGWAHVDSSCTSSPCTITDQSGMFTSITRGSAGTYTANFASTFGVHPTCKPVSKTSGSACSYISSQSTSAVTFVMHACATGTATDAAFDLECTGPK